MKSSKVHVLKIDSGVIMHKYLAVFSTYWQLVLQRRATFVMDRIRSLALILSLYFLWNALLDQRGQFLGYNREQILSYVLGINFLRALVFTDHAWQTIGDISSGRLSAYLLYPVSYPGYCFSRCLAEKFLYTLSALAEMMILVGLFGAPFYLPGRWETVVLFFIATVAALCLSFFLASLVASAAFWSSESVGPLFCFELIVSFTSGAFFPLDVLPLAVQNTLKLLPFPYLVFFPLNIYLERLSPSGIYEGLCLQGLWIFLLWSAYRWVWNRGLKIYAAEGG